MLDKYIDCTPEFLHMVSAGLKTCCVVPGICYEGDNITFREVKKGLLTGRCVKVTVTECEDYPDGGRLVSFLVLYPELEPRIPVKAYIELYHLYTNVCRERDALKEGLQA